MEPNLLEKKKEILNEKYIKKKVIDSARRANLENINKQALTLL